MSKLVLENFSIEYWDSFSSSEQLHQDWVSDRLIICIEWPKSCKKEFLEFKDTLQEIYFEKSKKSSNKDEVFENTIKVINEKYSSKFAWANMLIWLYTNSSLHVTQVWWSECYLIRNERVSVVCESEISVLQEDEKEEDLFVDISCWSLLNDDIVIFSCKRLLKHFTSDQLVSAFNWIAEWVDFIKEFYSREEVSNSVVAMHVCKESVFASRAGNLAWFWKNHWEKFVDNVQSTVDKLISFVVNRTNYPYETIQKTLIASFWVLVIVFFITIVAFSSQNTKEKAIYETSKIWILKIDKLLEVAESRALMQSVSEANEILNEVEKSANNILDEWMFREEAIIILEKVQKMRDDINKVTRFKNIDDKILFDLSTVDSSIKLNWFAHLSWEYFAYDENKFYKIVLNKFEWEYPFVDNEKIKNIVVMKDLNKVIVFSDSNTLYEFDWKEFQQITVSDEFWLKNYISLASYSRFLYLLDNWWANVWTWEDLSETKVWQIWKYSRWKSNYSGAKPYVKNIDFKNALSLSIDWSIYILYKDWLIIQLYSWKEVGFSYIGDNEIIKDSSEIFTDIDYLNLYLFDRVNNKIVLLEKTREWAKLKRQYLFEDIVVTWFFIDKDEREMVVTWNNALYKISL